MSKYETLIAFVMENIFNTPNDKESLRFFNQLETSASDEYSARVPFDTMTNSDLAVLVVERADDLEFLVGKYNKASDVPEHKRIKEITLDELCNDFGQREYGLHELVTVTEFERLLKVFESDPFLLALPYVVEGRGIYFTPVSLVNAIIKICEGHLSACFASDVPIMKAYANYEIVKIANRIKSSIMIAGHISKKEIEELYGYNGELDLEETVVLGDIKYYSSKSVREYLKDMVSKNGLFRRGLGRAKTHIDVRRPGSGDILPEQLMPADIRTQQLLSTKRPDLLGASYREPMCITDLKEYEEFLPAICKVLKGEKL